MENIEYKGYTIKIEYDDINESPRNWDNIGTMICFHKRYDLGDKHNFRHEDYNNWEEMQEAIKKEFGKCIILPLYLYDHSGLSLKTFLHGFHGAWDCGKVGFIVCSYAKAKKEFILKKGQSIKKRIEKCLLNEIETYSKYLNGEVYYFKIEDKDGETIDSCGGWYEENDAIVEAKSIIDFQVKEDEKILNETKAFVLG